MRHYPDSSDLCGSRFVLLGTGALFTIRVLQTLLDAQVSPVAYLHHGPLRPATSAFAGIPIEHRISGSSVFGLMQKHRLAWVEQAEENLPRQLAALDVDFILVACWPELIDTLSIAKAKCAALNLHPSLLPAYRGPDPISAQLKAGDHRFGVSLHLLSRQFDRGDIVAQAVLPVPDPADATMIESTAAVEGARLFIEALHSYPDWRLRAQRA